MRQELTFADIQTGCNADRPRNAVWRMSIILEECLNMLFECSKIELDIDDYDEFNEGLREFEADQLEIATDPDAFTEKLHALEANL